VVSQVEVAVHGTAGVHRLEGHVPFGPARPDPALTGPGNWPAARATHSSRIVLLVLLHRHMDDSDVIAGIGAALSVGAHTAEVVAVGARKVAETRGGPVTGTEACSQASAGQDVQVTSLTMRRIAGFTSIGFFGGTTGIVTEIIGRGLGP
jgi:hypothetical protein